MAAQNEQDAVKPDDIVILVTGKNIQNNRVLVVTPDIDGKIDITNHGDSVFKAYSTRTGKPVVVYGDNGRSDTWAISKTAGFVKFEEDGRFHLYVNSIGSHPIQASPETGGKYGLPPTLPAEFLKSENPFQSLFSAVGDHDAAKSVAAMMQHILSAGLSREEMKVLINRIRDIEKQQANNVATGLG